MAKVTYDDLVGLADAEFDSLLQGLGSKVGYILDAARINADDTAIEQKDADWNSIAIETVEMQLCYEKDQETVAWFVSHGVKF